MKIITSVGVVCFMSACLTQRDDHQHQLCVGIQAEPLPGVQQIRITTSTQGAPQSQRTSLSELPLETWIALRGDPQLSLLVEGLDMNGTPIITRSARASLPISDPTPQLLRVRLIGQCLASIMGVPVAPTCSTPRQTCIAGRCQDDTLLLSDLEPYQPGWAVDLPDVCRPADAGAPEVVVGTGQTEYTPVSTGQVLQAERGPQGGHHLYVGVRQRNLHRTGSTTTITGVRPDTGVAIPPTAFVFSFEPDDGGYCKLYGLRYQLDNGNAEYTQFLDHDLDLTVTIRDFSGTFGTNTVRIHVAPTVIGGM